ncbi:MAG: DNA alkylation repair protein [Treponema sp.]|jgi:3-methyladenine DNA glycosylase AlkD|nr:DNA alkylation repair protein [Treponema sp.]
MEQQKAITGREAVIQGLQELAEPKFRDFTASLTPGAQPIIGVRMPILRALAKEIRAGNPEMFLEQCRREFQEEILLEALVRSRRKTADYSGFLRNSEDFLDAVTNWAVSDTFSLSLVIPPEYRARFFRHTGTWLGRENPWHVRCALVIMLASYVDDEHIRPILAQMETLSHNDYYVQMGQAWLVSVCYVKFPEITGQWLAAGNVLNAPTLKMTVRKIQDSYRVPKDKKEEIKKIALS